MSYKYQQQQLLKIGYTIDQIVNSYEIKQVVKAEWKYLQQYKIYEVEMEERVQAKYQTWLAPYLESIKYFLKYGDIAKTPVLVIRLACSILLVVPVLGLVAVHLLPKQSHPPKEQSQDVQQQELPLEESLRRFQQVQQER